MSAAATLWFGLVFFVTAPLLTALAVLVWTLTLPFDPHRRVLHALVCRCCFLYLRCWPGWRVRVEGRERLPSGACVLVANHQSVSDIFAAMGLFRQFKFVSKASLFKLPFIGWTMTLLRYVRVERGSMGSTRAMLEACKTWLARGVPVLIFPEGTYREHADLLPFKRGPFKLAREMRVPIVPVVLKGTYELIPGDGPWFSPRAEVRIVVLQAVPPPGSEAEDGEVAMAVRGQIAAVLRGEGRKTPAH